MRHPGWQETKGLAAVVVAVVALAVWVVIAVVGVGVGVGVGGACEGVDGSGRQCAGWTDVRVCVRGRTHEGGRPCGRITKAWRIRPRGWMGRGDRAGAIRHGAAGRVDGWGGATARVQSGMAQQAAWMDGAGRPRGRNQAWRSRPRGWMGRGDRVGAIRHGAAGCVTRMASSFARAWDAGLTHVRHKAVAEACHKSAARAHLVI
eukprot:363661-Chlamydomonas_euryale.AAC.2